ncbi:1-phosphofructokinase family hexose kinase [Antrihabitans sp. YC2-6]|uniref:1-phosphofructokinase family hexose kinase n=1 Tax=Antrihabitans sp. YC2-6 TaxID=2799498 RepID=UPI0018F29958|nr:1-phosphofructokinase family hexose kinase [Antrihabitans sp. YC2-6]MBJ8347029.1 1-phosphofructokinase family hexose kinase [Antrihabitans sp. YC2-6]
MPEIVTLTMNPALDISTSAAHVVPTNKLRCTKPQYDPGGGGINVARVANVLGGDVVAVFPSGGASGGVLESLIAAEQVPFRTVPNGGSVRESFAVDDRELSEQYRFVLPGPELSIREQDECLEVFTETAGNARFVIASGSLPPGVSPDFYQRVSDAAAKVGAQFILDTSGAALQRTHTGVFLLKPSIRELRESVGGDLTTRSEQAGAAQRWIRAGKCEIVILSLGAHGALAITADSDEWFPSIEMPVRSAVGAGDAMGGAIAVGLSRDWSLHESVRFGIAAAAASLTVPGTGLCRRSEVEELFITQSDSRCSEAIESIRRIEKERERQCSAC